MLFKRKQVTANTYNIYVSDRSSLLWTRFIY